MLTTWTFNTSAGAGVVTADNVDFAKVLVKNKYGIELTNVDLVPMVTKTRYCRLLRWEDCNNQD